MSGCIMSFVNPLIQKLIDPLVNHVSYALCVGRHLKALDDKIKILKLKKKDVKDVIEIDEGQRKEATNEVRGWLETVEKLEEDANSISNKYRNRNCMFHGACSLNCFADHSIGADAVKLKEDVEEELRRRDGFREITKEVPPPVAQHVPLTTLPEVSRSQIESKLCEALSFLRNDGKSILGIWGMGGVGKTTLLKQINNALAEDPSSLGFDRVVFVTASREWTIEKIQKLISMELGLREEGNHSNNIFNYLRNKNKGFVILLDDLWSRLDLQDVGVPPLGTVGNCKRKLILTTRDRQVCRDMEADPTIRVDCLRDEVARLLFRAEVGEETINSHPRIPDLADEVADECGGLPKALICIARAMVGKQRVNSWEKAIKDLQRSKISIVAGMEDPLPLLKFSYDHLKNARIPRIQECLLHCALWPEDYEIPISGLIECWMGHGLLGEFDSIEEAYNSGDEIIDILENASLLESVEEDAHPVFGGWSPTIDDSTTCIPPFFTSNMYYPYPGPPYYMCSRSREPLVERPQHLRRARVSLHDLIRDMALWIAREEKWLVLDKAPLDEKSWREPHKMSLMHNNITALPSNMPCDSNLITLMLQGNSLSHRHLRILQNFHALAYLDLSHNSLIENVPIEICHLGKLEYLNLSYTGIHELPHELQNLKNLKYLVLRGIFITEVSGQLLSGLVRLEVLDLCSPFKSNFKPSHIPQNPVIDNLDCLEGRLKALGLNAYSMTELNKLASMSKAIPVMGLCLRLQSAENVTTLRLLPPNSWSKFGELFIDGRDSPCTEELVMVTSPECIYTEELVMVTSPECIYIHAFECLKEIIWQRDMEQRNAVQNIRRVCISYCPRLKHVSWLVKLPLLESVILYSCENLEQLVCEEVSAAEEMEEKYKHTFRTLRELSLYSLPELKTICNHVFTFHSLEKLAVLRLKNLPLDSPASCSKLRKIQCERDWWQNLEVADDMRTLLQPLTQFEYGYDSCVIM